MSEAKWSEPFLVAGDSYFLSVQVKCDVWMNWRIWEVTGWSMDGVPAYVGCGSECTTDCTEENASWEGFIKWDGCFQAYLKDINLHFDGLSDVLVGMDSLRDAFAAVFAEASTRLERWNAELAE